MGASGKGDIQCVEAILQRGADANIQSYVSSGKAMRCLLLICVLVVCVTWGVIHE